MCLFSGVDADVQDHMYIGSVFVFVAKESDHGKSSRLRPLQRWTVMYESADEDIKR